MGHNVSRYSKRWSDTDSVVTETELMGRCNAGNPNHLSCCMNLLQYNPMIGIFI